jgi:hypothetical protein
MVVDQSGKEDLLVDDVNNPYRSPGADEPDASVPEEGVDPRTIGKARYVPTVAILMIAHGVLMFVAACGLIGMTVFMTPQIAQQIEDQQKMQRAQNPNAPVFTKDGWQTMLTAIYGGMAAVLCIIGVVNLFAGIQNYRYHYRILGVISLVINMGAILFCWCLPFSLGLLIFGMIIYLSPEADRAFQWQSSHLKQ